MIIFSKTTITAAAAFMLTMTVSMMMMMFATVHAESSITVTQSTEDGLEVECVGNLDCEIIGDDTVVATSEDNTTSATAVTTNDLNQSNTIQSGNDFDIIDDEQDLGAMIEGMVDRLLDEISRKLATLDISI
jgi:hypothetical protein